MKGISQFNKIMTNINNLNLKNIKRVYTKVIVGLLFLSSFFIFNGFWIDLINTYWVNPYISKLDKFQSIASCVIFAIAIIAYYSLVLKFEKIFSINHSSFNKINGFGEKILNSVIYDLPRIAQIYKICLDNGLQFKKTDINLIQMKKITVTGKGPYPRKELEEKIKRMGYELINLSKESEMLVCADTSSTSNKMKKAQKLNIPIITYEEFFNV